MSASAGKRTPANKGKSKGKGKGKRPAASLARPPAKCAKSLSDLLADIKEQATCPVCHEIEDALFQCREGHIVCGLCKDKLALPRKCPTCRVHMDFPTRNRALEAMTATFKTLPCKWAANGCSRLFFSHQKAASWMKRQFTMSSIMT